MSIEMISDFGDDNLENHVTVEDLAALQFDPIPAAGDIGHDRESWAQESEEVRRSVVFAGSILAKNRDELMCSAAQAIAIGDFDAWLQLARSFRSISERIRGLADIIEDARIRALVVIAEYSLTNEAPP
jgi:hypothetical protein